MLRSFRCAISGILRAFQEERNLKIMAGVFILVIAAGFLFQVSSAEWTVLLILCGIVISLELINSAIEAVVDLSTPKMHPLAEKAKDIAAGAVLVFCIISLIVGCIVFIPHILRLIPIFPRT